MSIPAFGWALEQGAALNLRPSDRLLLLYLADQANGEMLCRSGQQRIERFTGLAPNTIRASAARLEEAQLIRAIASIGRVTKYEILRSTPANGAGVTPAKRHRVTPANGAGVTPANVASNPSTDCPPPPQNVGGTPANRAPVPSPSQESSPKTGAGAPEGKQAKNSDSGGGDEAARSSGPPKAPQAGTTNSGKEPPATELDTTSFQAFLEEKRAIRATVPAAGPEAVLRGEILPPDAPVGPQVTANLVRSVVRGFKTNYPPRAPTHTVNQQREANPRVIPPTPHYLSGSVLAAARAAARVHAP